MSEEAELQTPHRSLEHNTVEGESPALRFDAVLSGALQAALGEGNDSVVWTDCDDAVVVHAAGARVWRQDDAVFAEVALETDETGPEALLVALVPGTGHDKPVLTSTLPWGDSRLARRWGSIVQELTWKVVAERLE